MTSAVWQDRAACRNTVTSGVITSPDDDLFFSPDDEELTETAKRYCALCPVRSECFAEFTRLPVKVGVWAGQSHEIGKLATRDRNTKARADAVQDRRMALYQQGLTDHELAQSEWISKTAASNWRTRNGLPPNTKTKMGGNVKYTSERRFQWHAEGWTDEQMAARDGVELTTVQRWRYRHQLPRNTGQPSYNNVIAFRRDTVRRNGTEGMSEVN